MVNAIRWGWDRDRLKMGVAEWNRSRNHERGYIPHLTEADLEELDLSGADLRLADLRGVYLCGARLAGADLRKADLRRAHLPGSDLKRADLRGANLRGADLRGAELEGARLGGTVLVETILDPARWTTPLMALWENAGRDRRLLLIWALRDGTVLHRKWVNGIRACPEAILSERGAETDAFMLAWDTGAIGESQLLAVLAAAPAKVMSAAG